MQNERRALLAEIRADKTADGVSKIAGLGVKYGSLSQDFGGWKERFQAGAFDLSANNIRCLFNHDSNFVLGDTQSKTLRLTDKSDGLYFDCDLPQTRTIQDLAGDPIARGTVTGCSFMFRAVDTKWETLDGIDVRTVAKAEIYEVGPVTWPAYPETNVSARAIGELAEYRSGKAPVKPSAALAAEKLALGHALSEDEKNEFRALIQKFEPNTFNPVEAAARARMLQLLAINQGA